MELNVKEIADKADMIINGYAFTKENDQVRVLNLNCLNHAAVIYHDQIIATNMDEIESEIVLEYYKKDKKFMEDDDAEIL